MSENRLSDEAMKFIDMHLQAHAQARDHAMQKKVIAFFLANLLVLSGIVYAVYDLPTTIWQTASDTATRKATDAALKYVQEESDEVKEQWEQASRLVLGSLEVQVATVAKLLGDTQHSIGFETGKLASVKERMDELSKLATGFDGQQGRGLIEDLRSLTDEINSPDGIRQLGQITKDIAAMNDALARNASDRKSALDKLRASLKEQQHRIEQAERNAVKLIASLAAMDQQLAGHLNSKHTLFKVQFLSTGQDTTIRPPDEGRISDWDIIVLPLSPGREPTLGSNPLHKLSDYSLGNDPTAVLNWFTCYAEPAGQEEWRIVGKQRLYNPLLGTNKDYALDVCVLMMAKATKGLTE